MKKHTPASAPSPTQKKKPSKTGKKIDLVDEKTATSGHLSDGHDGPVQKRLALDTLTCSPEVQPREKIDDCVSSEYAELLENGKGLPPIDVFYDGEDHWVAEGFHRVAAHEKAGRTDIDCNVYRGSKEDAQWHALQSNQTHGLRRTNADKERAVKMALEHPEGAGLSDNKIAELVGVSATTVGKYRSQAEATIQNGKSTERRGQDGRTINTARIGKSAKKAKAKPGTEFEADVPADSVPPEVEPIDQDDICPRGGNHEPGEDGVCARCYEPDCAEVNNDDDLESSREESSPSDESLGCEPECSEDLIAKVEESLTDIQDAVVGILQDEEIAALPESHPLAARLHRLDDAVKDVTDWLARHPANPVPASKAACSRTSGRGASRKHGPSTRGHKTPKEEPSGSHAVRVPDAPEAPTRENPAQVEVNGTVYNVAITNGQWFHWKADCPVAGWTACSDDFAKLIQVELERSRCANPSNAARDQDALP